jgi:PTH1 family peptidyl-tRNA hydrolase
MRIGIDRPPGQMPSEAYVLQVFGRDELPIVEQTYQQAVEAVGVILTRGFEMAMNQFNR